MEALLLLDFMTQDMAFISSIQHTTQSKSVISTLYRTKKNMIAGLNRTQTTQFEHTHREKGWLEF